MKLIIMQCDKKDAGSCLATVYNLCSHVIDGPGGGGEYADARFTSPQTGNGQVAGKEIARGCCMQ
jgi:hypothetical protein